MKPENKKMKTFLTANGINATPKYLHKGSLAGCWRLYNLKEKWTQALIDKLTTQGFLGYDGLPLGRYSGNGGLFSVFTRFKGDVWMF